jgi:hypothetical protein
MNLFRIIINLSAGAVSIVLATKRSWNDRENNGKTIMPHQRKNPPVVSFTTELKGYHYIPRLFQQEGLTAKIPSVRQLAEYQRCSKYSSQEFRQQLFRLSIRFFKILRSSCIRPVFMELKRLELDSLGVFRRCPKFRTDQISGEEFQFPENLRKAMGEILPHLSIGGPRGIYSHQHILRYVSTVGETIYFSPLKLYRFLGGHASMRRIKEVAVRETSFEVPVVFGQLNVDALLLIFVWVFKISPETFSNLRATCLWMYNLNPLVSISMLVPENDFFEYVVALQNVPQILATNLIRRSGVFLSISESIQCSFLSKMSFLSYSAGNSGILALQLFPFGIWDDPTALLRILDQSLGNRDTMLLGALNSLSYTLALHRTDREFIGSSVEPIEAILRYAATHGDPQPGGPFAIAIENLLFRLQYNLTKSIKSIYYSDNTNAIVKIFQAMKEGDILIKSSADGHRN